MSWFGAFALPYAMHVPAALAGALAVGSLWKAADPVQATLGHALFDGIVACLVTLGLDMGSGFIFAVWSAAALLCAWTAPMVCPHMASLVSPMFPLS